VVPVQAIHVLHVMGLPLQRLAPRIVLILQPVQTHQKQKQNQRLSPTVQNIGNKIIHVQMVHARVRKVGVSLANTRKLVLAAQKIPHNVKEKKIAAPRRLVLVATMVLVHIVLGRLLVTHTIILVLVGLAIIPVAPALVAHVYQIVSAIVRIMQRVV